MKKFLLSTLITFISLSLLSQSCLPEGITFTTQQQIDNFQTDNPDCTEIEGDVLIQGDNITNLDGLNALTTFLGNLSIGNSSGGNPNLANLNGLANVTFIGGNIDLVGNTNLTSLSGLNNLTSVGGYFGIAHNYTLTSLSGLEGLTTIGSFLAINFNYALTSVAELESLNSIGGDLQILNSLLTSISGLDNINPESIENIFIYDNNQLSECEILSICNYLASPNGTIEIYDNSLGCNSQEEVEEACGIVSIDEVSIVEDITSAPNPFTTSTILSYELRQPEKVYLSIYNHLGQLVYQHSEEQMQGSQQLQWDAQGLAEGIYYYRLEAGDQVANGKLVKVR